MFQNIDRCLSWEFTNGAQITLSGVTVTTPDRQHTQCPTTWAKFLVQLPLEAPTDVDTLTLAALAPTFTGGLVMPARITIGEPLYGKVYDAFVAHAYIQQGRIGWEAAAQLYENVDLVGALLVRGYNASFEPADRLIFCEHPSPTAHPNQ